VSNDDDPSTAARDSRRWLIGVVISLVFGLFSVVMALLSYSTRATPAAPPARAPAVQEGPSAEPLRRANPRRERHPNR